MYEFAGMKIYERAADPETRTVKRLWKERLFSRPWKPWISTKQIPHIENIARNKEYIIISGEVHATRQGIENLKNNA